MKQILKIFSCITVLFFLIGCGFQLRGNVTIPEHLKTIHISPNDPYDPFQRELRRTLSKHKVTVLEQPSDKSAVLKLSTVEIQEQVTAIGTDGQAQRVKLILSIKYELTQSKYKIERSIQRTREFTNNSNALLSSNQERQVIQEELQKEVLTELLRQLSSKYESSSHKKDYITNDLPPC